MSGREPSRRPCANWERAEPTGVELFEAGDVFVLRAHHRLSSGSGLSGEPGGHGAAVAAKGRVRLGWGRAQEDRGTRNLVPYAGANLIRFNGIRNYPISALARAPRQEPRSLDTTARGLPMPRAEKIPDATSQSRAGNYTAATQYPQWRLDATEGPLSLGPITISNDCLCCANSHWRLPCLVRPTEWSGQRSALRPTWSASTRKR
jgi:hypothetical protein